MCPQNLAYVSNTLEYAYDDWCVSQFAKALGKKGEYKTFRKRAYNYQNMFDPETKFMRPRHEDGSMERGIRSYLAHQEMNLWKVIPGNIHFLFLMM